MPTPSSMVVPPSLVNVIREVRCIVEAGQTLLSWRRSEQSQLDGTPVLVIPGFCATDISTWALRSQVARCGGQPSGWGLGMNRGPRSGVVERLGVRLQTLAARAGKPVAIVGWSLGGLLARLVASHHREAVSQVITLGSPLTADPNATRLGPLFRLLSGNIPETQIDTMLKQAQTVPVTSIFSRSDGVVAWQASAHAKGQVRAMEVESSHLGMACNRSVLDLVVGLIAERSGRVSAAMPQGSPASA